MEIQIVKLLIMISFFAILATETALKEISIIRKIDSVILNAKFNQIHFMIHSWNPLQDNRDGLTEIKLALLHISKDSMQRA